MADQRNTLDKWWKSLLAAIVMAAAAVYLNVTITDAERSGDTFSLPVILSQIYDLFGKWPVVGFFGLLSAVALIMAIAQLVRGPEKVPAE